MPIELQYRDNGRGVFFICSGVLTANDVRAANEEVYSDEHLSTLRYLLFDYTGASRIELSSDEIRSLAEMDARAAKRSPDLLVAFISASDLSFGITRVWQAIIEESKIQSSIFRSIADAECWIEETLRDSRRDHED